MNRETELIDFIEEKSSTLNSLEDVDFTVEINEIIECICNGYTVEDDEEEYEIEELNPEEQMTVLQGIYNKLEEGKKIDFAREMIEHSQKNSDISNEVYSFFEKESQQWVDKNSELLEEGNDSESSDELEEEIEKEKENTPDLNYSDDLTVENKEETEEELTAIEKYEKDTNLRIKEYEDLEIVINKYNDIETKITNMLPENYEEIKNEIEELGEKHPELKDELLVMLESKKEGKLLTTSSDVAQKQANFINEAIETTLDTTSYENELVTKEKNKVFYIEQENKLSNEIEVLKSEIESINLEMEKPENQYRKGFFEADIIKKQEEIATREEKIETIKNELEILDKEIEEIKEIIAKKEDIEFTYNLITKQYEKELEKVKQEKEVLINKKPEIENEINLIKENITKLSQEISQLELVLGVNLGNGLGISDEQRKTFENALQNKKTELIVEKNKLAEKEKELEDFDIKLSDIDEEINLRENEIIIRNDYYKLVTDINSLVDSKEINEEKVNNIKTEIENSSLEDELKQELKEKLEKTIEFTKNKSDNGLAIDKYINKYKDLDVEIKERKENISKYNEVITNIKEIEIKNKQGQEIKEELAEVKEKISKITDESLREELNKYLEKALTLKIENVEKNPKKWHKWLAGAAGLVVGGGIVALTSIGAAAITITSIALKIGVNKYHQHLKKKEAELAKENIITGIEKPNEIQKSALAKFKEKMKDENFVKNINWFLNGAIIGSSVMSFAESMNAQSNNITETQQNAPTQDAGIDSAKTESISDIRVGSNAEGMDLSKGYDQARWSIDGVNPESLNQGIMNDGNTIIEQIRGTDGNLYTSLEEARSAGLELNDISFKMVDSTNGIGRAWINAEDALGTLGRIR